MSSEEEMAAHLAEDEAIARAAAFGSDPRSARWAAAAHPSESVIVMDEAGSAVVYNEGSPSDEEAAHIARHDPARALRFVEAMRAIIRESSGKGHGWAEREPAYYGGLEYAIAILAGVYEG